MREQKQYIPDIFAEASKRKDASCRKDKLSGEIAGKLGALITEHGGWDSEKKEIVYIGGFPIFDGEEGLETDNFYHSEVNFAATRKDGFLPDSITVSVHKNGEVDTKKLFTIMSWWSVDTQVFKIEDNLGREISKIKDLKKINKLVDRICKYGQIHLPATNVSNSSGK